MFAKTSPLAAAFGFALTIGGLATSPAATGDAYHQKIVQVSDLDLAQTAGRDTAERRLRAAATAVCATHDGLFGVDNACRDRAIANARLALDTQAAVGISR